MQGTAGAALLALGLSGLAAIWQGAASAQPADRGLSHETMHEMVHAMHGEVTAARMHQVEGAEQMMDQCASMIAVMGGMGMTGMRDDASRRPDGSDDGRPLRHGGHDGVTVS